MPHARRCDYGNDLKRHDEVMGTRTIFYALKHFVRRTIHLLARPVRRDKGRGGAVIQTYRGFGSREEVYLMGRVYRQPAGPSPTHLTSAKRDMLDVVRRVLRRGVRGAVLSAKVVPARDAGRSKTRELSDSITVQTDLDGYFRIRLKPTEPLSTRQRWHHVAIDLIAPQTLSSEGNAKGHGQIYLPPETAQRIVISDIDDTVMHTGVVNKLMMMWRLFMQGPRSRVAFPGVASLYRGLYHGPSGDQCNPMLYVSRAPWGIYEILDEFFRLHRIPVGPILFLREWGISWWRPLPRRAKDHKLLLIRDMLDIYCEYRCVLIGDSGQHDPEIYTRIVREYPGRIEAVYIRNVSGSSNRVSAIEELAKEVLESGSILMLASDSVSVAKHAAEHGLISQDSLLEVMADQVGDLDSPPRMPTYQVQRGTDNQTRHAVEQGELKAVLKQVDDADTPPNVIVESSERNM